MWHDYVSVEVSYEENLYTFSFIAFYYQKKKNLFSQARYKLWIWNPDSSMRGKAYIRSTVDTQCGVWWRSQHQCGQISEKPNLSLLHLSCWSKAYVKSFSTFHLSDKDIHSLFLFLSQGESSFPSCTTQETGTES